MQIVRRVFVMLLAGLVVCGTAESFAKGGKSGASRTILTARLAAVAGGPAAAKGAAKFDRSTSRTNFKTEGENLQRLNGRTALVLVNGKLIGSKPIALGRFELELSTQRGNVIPDMTAGTLVEVTVDGVRILSGGLR